MRYYSSIASAMVLQSTINSSVTSVPVDTVAGLPGSFPFSVIVNPGGVTEEIMSVTAIGGTTLTVTRGQDGSTASSHTAGEAVRHGISARDLLEPQQHIAASAAVHGLAGTVVGTTDTQVLTNKTVSGASNTITNVPGANLTGSNTVPKSVLPTTVVYTTDVQTLTNKSLTAPLVTSPTGIVKADVGLGNVDNTSDATKNAASATLTNKTFSGSANTVTNIGNTSLSTGIDAGKIASVSSSFVAKAALPTDTVYLAQTAAAQTTGSSAFTIASNWTLNSSSYIIGQLNAINFCLVVTRTGSTLSVGANGNSVDTLVATIAGGAGVANPTLSTPIVAMYGATVGNIGGWARVESDGTILFIAGGPNTDLLVGTVLTIAGTYYH